MKRKHKKALSISVFCAIVLVGFIFINSLFQPIWYSWSTIYTAKGFYEEPENSIETVFIGSSVSVSGITPMELYDEYGMCSYNLSSVSQPVLGSYAWLQEAYRFHPESLKTVVFEVSQLRSTSSEAYHHKCFDYMKMSKVKYNAIKEYANGDFKKLIEFIIPIAAYHDRWNDLDYTDLLYYVDDLLTGQRGYHFVTDTFLFDPASPIGIQNPVLDETVAEGYKPLVDVSMKYFQDIVKFCKEHDIELILMKTPTTRWDSGSHNQVQRVADKNDLTFLDYNFSPLYEQLDYVMPFDSYDGGIHLNYYGAHKVTKNLGKYLVENCDMTDVRGLEKYDYMKAQSHEYSTRVHLPVALRSMTTVEDYLELAVNEGNSVLIAVNNTAADALTEEQRAYFRSLGLEKLAGLQTNQSYVGVLEKGDKVVHESVEIKAADKLLSHKGSVGGVSYTVESGIFERANYASIKIPQKEHALNLRGLNIVVYNHEIKEVVDSTVFDTHADSSRDVYNVDKTKEVASIPDNVDIDEKSITGQVQLYLDRQADYMKAIALKKSLENGNKFALIENYMQDSDNIIVLACSKDISTILSDEDKNELSSYGLSEVTNLGYGDSYVAMIRGRDVQLEISDSNDKAITVERLGMYIKSAGVYCGRTCSININGVEYSPGADGLNVVVYDQSENRVIDRFSY